MDANVFMPNTVPLEGEELTLLTSNFKQPTVLALFFDNPTHQGPLTTTFDDNPVADHLGEHFEHPVDQGRPKHIHSKLVAIRHLHTGEGVISNLPRERGELPKGIQEGNEAAQMAKLDNEWE